MDDIVAKQQALISYSLRHGGWHNLPLPAHWIQISHRGAALFIHTKNCIIIDSHPIKLLGLGSDHEKRLVRSTIAQHQSAIHRNRWATCPFPEAGWMKLYFAQRRQLVYFHTVRCTLTAKHPSKGFTMNRMETTVQRVARGIATGSSSTNHEDGKRRRVHSTKTRAKSSTPPPGLSSSNTFEKYGRRRKKKKKQMAAASVATPSREESRLRKSVSLKHESNVKLNDQKDMGNVVRNSRIESKNGGRNKSQLRRRKRKTKSEIMDKSHDSKGSGTKHKSSGTTRIKSRASTGPKQQRQDHSQISSDGPVLQKRFSQSFDGAPSPMEKTISCPDVPQPPRPSRKRVPNFEAASKSKVQRRPRNRSLSNQFGGGSDRKSRSPSPSPSPSASASHKRDSKESRYPQHRGSAPPAEAHRTQDFPSKSWLHSSGSTMAGRSYTYSLSKSVINAAPRTNNVLFPLHRQQTLPSIASFDGPVSVRKRSHQKTRSHSLAESPSVDSKSTEHNGDGARGHSRKSGARSRRIAKKRRRNAVGLSSVDGDLSALAHSLRHWDDDKKDGGDPRKAASSPLLNRSVFSMDIDSGDESSASDLDIDGTRRGDEIKSNLNGSISDDDTESPVKRTRSVTEDVSLIQIADRLPTSQQAIKEQLPSDTNSRRRYRHRHGHESRTRQRSTTSRSSSLSSSPSRSSSVSSASSGHRSRRRSISSEHSDESTISSVASSSLSDSVSSENDSWSGSHGAQNWEKMKRNWENMMQMMSSAHRVSDTNHLQNAFVNMSGVLSPLHLSQGGGTMAPLALDGARDILAPTDSSFDDFMNQFVTDLKRERFGDRKPMDHAQRIMKLQDRIAAIQLVPSASSDASCSENEE